MSAKATHTGPHKYERVEAKTSGHIIYKCQLPGCPHYLPYEDLAVNRFSLCWGCGSVMTLDQQIVSWDKAKKPLCPTCKLERKERKLALQTIPNEEEYED